MRGQSGGKEFVTAHGFLGGDTPEPAFQPARALREKRRELPVESREERRRESPAVHRRDLAA